MNNSKTIWLVVIVLILILGGVAYYKSSGLGVTQSDDDLGNLVTSLDQEQSEEDQLLSTEDSNASALTDESSLVGNINNTYQNEL